MSTNANRSVVPHLLASMNMITNMAVVNLAGCVLHNFLVFSAILSRHTPMELCTSALDCLGSSFESTSSKCTLVNHDKMRQVVRSCRPLLSTRILHVWPPLQLENERCKLKITALKYKYDVNPHNYLPKNKSTRVKSQKTGNKCCEFIQNGSAASSAVLSFRRRRARLVASDPDKPQRVQRHLPLQLRISHVFSVLGGQSRISQGVPWPSNPPNAFVPNVKWHDNEPKILYTCDLFDKRTFYVHSRAIHGFSCHCTHKMFHS